MFVTLGVCVCMCDCVVFDFFLFLFVMFVLLHFMRNTLNTIIQEAQSMQKSTLFYVDHVRLYHV